MPSNTSITIDVDHCIACMTLWPSALVPALGIDPRLPPRVACGAKPRGGGWAFFPTTRFVRCVPDP